MNPYNLRYNYSLIQGYWALWSLRGTGAWDAGLCALGVCGVSPLSRQTANSKAKAKSQTPNPLRVLSPSRPPNPRNPSRPKLQLARTRPKAIEAPTTRNLSKTKAERPLAPAQPTASPTSECRNPTLRTGSGKPHFEISKNWILVS